MLIKSIEHCVTNAIRKYHPRGVVLIFLLCASHGFMAFSQSFNKEVCSERLKMLQRLLERKHFSPRKFDASFSGEVFDKFMARLDPQGVYFVASEVKALRDEEERNRQGFLDGNVAMLQSAIGTYRKSLLRADSISSQILRTPFNLTSNESISFSKEGKMVVPTGVGFMTEWVRYLRYQTLKEMLYMEEESGNSKGAHFTPDLKKLESEARNRVARFRHRRILRKLDAPEGFDEFVVGAYFNAVASCFDPHTEFFMPAEKETFDADVSGQGYYFGMSVTENDHNEIEIERLIPGGPAWKSGALHKGDKLIKFQWEGASPVELNGATTQEVDELLEPGGHTSLAITFQRADGSIQTVSLKKEKIREEENFVKSFVLSGARKIGYITLPGFYSEWETEDKTSCANDLAREIIKLKKEGIEGLVLDIRYNGGGSIAEAIDIAGIFIDEGPLCMVKERTGKVITLKDFNRGTIYDGPLVIMVNKESASASELLAGVLQDYRRAIIVGSNTFGKATAQVVFPMDSSHKSAKEGYVKVTVERLYRVTGRTAQYEGVTPDIHLPDIFDALDFGEAELPYALIPDSIRANRYFHPLPALPLTDLSQKSLVRTRGNKFFQAVAAFSADFRKKKIGKTDIPLRWKDFSRFNPLTATAMRDGLDENPNFLKVSLNRDDLTRNTIDAYSEELDAERVKTIQNDAYIAEVYKILHDYLR